MAQYVLKKPKGWLWTDKKYSLSDIAVAIASNQISTEWGAHDSKSQFKISDLLAIDDPDRELRVGLSYQKSKTAQIYLLIQEVQHGPYSFEQVMSMQKSGTITLNCFFWFDGLDEWLPLISLIAICDKISNVVSEKNYAPFIRLGYLFVILGLAAVFYFIAMYDTSVKVSSPLAAALDLGRVNNFGRMDTKQTGIIMGCCSTLLGFGLLMYGNSKKAVC